MSLKDIIRKYTPTSLLEWNRGRKKAKRNAELKSQANRGGALSKEDILLDLEKIGMVKGDHVLVHSSLSKIGFLKDGADTFIDALIEAVGDEGTILMPTSPNNVYQLNYIRNTPFFDVLNSPSKTGKMTEVFRTRPEAIRSWHPTEPVSAIGKLAIEFTKDHFNQLTPYNENSPFSKLAKHNGKILYVGVGLSQAGTSLHTLEDAVDFKFPVYYPEIFEFTVIDDKGLKHQVKTKVHDPAWSKQRKCDDLIPMFEKEGAMTIAQIGQARTLVVDAKRFFDVMLKAYESEGVTMYTPKGS